MQFINKAIVNKTKQKTKYILNGRKGIWQTTTNNYHFFVPDDITSEEADALIDKFYYDVYDSAMESAYLLRDSSTNTAVESGKDEKSNKDVSYQEVARAFCVFLNILNSFPVRYHKRIISLYSSQYPSVNWTGIYVDYFL